MRNKNIFSLIIVIIGTMGILSFVFEDAFITNPDNPLMSLQLFKYFTIQSNLIAIIYFWVCYSLKANEKSIKWKNYLGGVMIFTTITMLIYAVYLENFESVGLGLVGNICLHYLNPLLIIGFFIYYRSEYLFTKKDPFIWIVYPVTYIIFVVIWGSITNDFLYPFFQVGEIGISGLIVSIAGLIALFFVLSFSLVKIVSKK